MELTLKCICCGHERAFENDAEAFAAGWNTPDQFSVAPLCGFCPTAIYLKEGPIDHVENHEFCHLKWTLEGHPEDLEEQLNN